MASNESVEGWEAVFGQAQGKLERSSNGSSVSREFLPFLFSLGPKDTQHLRLCVSDFHEQTWQDDFSVSQLRDLGDDVGIGEKLDDFLTYLRVAFSSKHVKLLLGGLDDGFGGASSGRLIAQKTPGTPFVPLSLKRLDGPAADDAKGSIALGNFQAFLELSSSVVSEKAQVAGLKAALAAEKATTEQLKEQIDASSLSFKSRHKLKRNFNHLSASVSQQPSLPSTQHDTQVVLPSLPTVVSGTLDDGKEMAVPKAPGSSSRVHVAPSARRVKRRGTVIKGD